MSSLFGSTTKTSSSSTEPYSGDYADQLSEFYDLLKSNLDTDASAYTGDLSAGLTDTQTTATSNLSNLINDSVISDTASGDYLDPSTNKYLEATYQAAADDVSKSLGTANDNVNSQFNTRGLYNSSARMESLQNQADSATDTLSDLANSIYSTAYTNERTNQLNAANTLADLNSTLYDEGTTEQTTNQTALDKQYTEYLRQLGVDDDDITDMLSYFSLVKNPTTSSSSTESSDTGIASLLTGK